MRILILGLITITFVILGPADVPNLFAQAPLASSISLEHQDRKRKTLAISITIRNVSNNDVIIDKTGPFYRVDVTKYGSRLKNGYTTEDAFFEIIGHGNDPAYLQLPPGGAFASRRILPLDAKFFEKARRYGITLTYGHFRTAEFQNLRVWRGTVESNVVEFRL